MLPAKLQDIVKNHDPEDIAISILRINNENPAPSFTIQISGFGYNDEEDYLHEWTIDTVQYRSSSISLDPASSIVISTDSPLLWYYKDWQCSIYFDGSCSDTDKLFLDLYRIHHSLFGGLLSFEDTLNQPYHFDGLIKSENGLLANGPKNLLKKYASALSKHKMRYSIIGDRRPQYWDGEKHNDETCNAKILFIENSYIIADEFIFIEQ